MDLNDRKPNRLINYDYSSNGLYFVTICTKKRVQYLSQITFGENDVGNAALGIPHVILTEYGKIVNDNIRKINEIYRYVSVIKYVVMPDHIHMILFVSDHEDNVGGTPRAAFPTKSVSQIINALKSISTKQIAIISTGLATVSPLLVFFSTEVRMYPMVVFLVMLSLNYLVDFEQKNDIKSLLKLTTANVVKVKDDTDLSTFKTIHKGDYCISLRSFQGGFEYSEYEGVVSPAYQVFYPIKEICDRFYKYLFKANCFINEMNSHTMSLRDGKNIAFDDFGNTYIPYPPIEEQIAIADYLDLQCGKVQEIADELQHQMDTLEKYRQSLVFDCVTGKKDI